MLHRHLNHDRYTLAAIDDVIEIQLASPLPYDLEEINLTEYKQLAPKWHDWNAIRSACIACSNLIFDRIIGAEGPDTAEN